MTRSPVAGPRIGTPRDPAVDTSAARCGESAPTVRNQIAPTRTRRTTSAAPPTWSACGWVTTNRSSVRRPLLCSQSAARPSSPASTSTRASGDSTRKASPWPTSMAVTTRLAGARPPTAAGASEAANRTSVASAVPRAARVRGGRTRAAQPASNAATVRGRASSAPPPRPAKVCATASTPRAGQPASAKTHVPASRWTAATTAATKPIDAASAATGTASRLAGTEASGTVPKVVSNSGTTAICAPSVTASRSATRPGIRRRRRRTRGATTRTPAVAVADSSSPSEPASRGSSSTNSTAAPASA